jgi:hypothetical protein
MSSKLSAVCAAAGSTTAWLPLLSFFLPVCGKGRDNLDETTRTTTNDKDGER